MAGRWIDLFSTLTAKTSTIDGTESTTIADAGLTKKATLLDIIRYGGGNSTRVTTIGDANIHQKSDGTMWLEVTGQTAGNARGAGAFDWQAGRTAATQVASASLGIAMGQRNTVTGGSGSVALGSANTSSGAYSTCLGAENIASGTGSAAIGSYCRATASGAIALGGAYLLAVNMNQIGFGMGPNYGRAQGNLQTFYTATTDASATVLNITGTATDRMVIPAMRACAITGLVTAMSDATDGYKVKAWEIKAVITRDNSNSTRIIGTPTITVLGNDADAAGWAITSITADDTNESLAITVTGEAATNIRFQASLFYSQVGW